MIFVRRAGILADGGSGDEENYDLGQQPGRAGHWREVGWVRIVNGAWGHAESLRGTLKRAAVGC